MSLKKTFSTSQKLEQEGVWVQYPGAKFLLARAGGSNRAYARRLDALMKPHRRALARGTLDDATADALLMQAFAETVVLGWDGVLAEDLGREGTDPVQYSSSVCVELFKALPELWRDLRDQASEMAIYRAEVREDEEKNS